MKNLSFRFLKFAVKPSMFTALILSFKLSAFAVGVLDASFGTNGKAVVAVGNQVYATATAIQPDGKIVVAGYGKIQDAPEDAVLIRLNADGTLDQSFGTGGKVIAAISSGLDLVGAVALAPDGKIIIAGGTRTPRTETATDFFIARFNPNGTPDTAFGNGGVSIASSGESDYFNAVALQPDGKIVAAGSGAAARFNPNGSLDANFGGGIVALDFPNYSGETYSAISLLANGQLVVGGTARYTPSFPVPYASSSIVTLLESNGTINSSFGNQGFTAIGLSHFVYGFDLTVLADGKIITTGANTARLLGNGTVDSTFPFSAAGSRLAVLPGGNVVVINHLEPVTEYLSVYTPGGRLIGQAQNFGGNDIAAQPDGKIVLIDSTQTEFTVTRLNGIPSKATRAADFDDDGKNDIAVLRPSNSAFYVSRSQSGFAGYNVTGESNFETRRIIPEKFSNQNTFAFWQVAGNAANSPASFCAVNASGNRECVQWGMNGDVPVGGDYDGDGYTDYTVFRPSNGYWYVRSSAVGSQISAVQWGTSGDQPVPADYDYDGITDTAIYRPSTGTWWIRRSSDNTFFGVAFGAAGDVPVPGDYDGDGRADFVVFRPSNGYWYLLTTTEGFKALPFGIGSDVPVSGDFDGDGKHDLGVFRQGNWYLQQSRDGFKAVQFGFGSDIPVSVSYRN